MGHHLNKLALLTYNTENLYSKLSDVSFAHYVSRFDSICLTETFVGDQLDFSPVFTDYTKFHAPAKKVSVCSIIWLKDI